MKSSKLVTYLIEVGKYELRIQIARQILAQNMNFSPAWLIAILKQSSPPQGKNKKDKQIDGLTLSQFKVLFSVVGFVCDNDQAKQIFQYFDRENKGVINNNDFFQFLLPNIRDGLRKAAIKRTVEDIQLTFELRYGLKRLFSEILGARAGLKLYSGDFKQKSIKFTEPPAVSKEDIKNFLNKYCRYPTQAQLTLIYHSVINQKSKQISSSQVASIIQESSQQIQFLSKNPLVLNQKIQNQLINLKVKQVQAVRGIQKIIKKGQIQSERLRNMYNQKQDLFQGWSKGKQVQLQQPKDFTKRYDMKQNESPGAPSKKYTVSKNDPTYQIEPKQRASQAFTHPNFKIPRTTSIIHADQKPNQNSKQAKQSSELKRASQLAEKLLVTHQIPKQQKYKQTPTPYKKLQSAPTIFYPSRKKSAQSDFTLLVNNNIQTEYQIQHQKQDNQNRIRDIKTSLRSQANY